MRVQRGGRGPSRLSQRHGLWALSAAVLAAHLLLTASLVDQRIGWGSADKPAPRIDVAFVRELAPTAPAAPAPRDALASVPARLPAVAQQARAAASAPTLADAAPVPAPGSPETPPLAPPEAPLALALPDATAVAVTVPAPDPMPVSVPVPVPMPMPMPMPAAPVAAPATAVLNAPTAPSATTAPTAPTAPTANFDWPPSTRMNYLLTGHYRGPVNGQAQVEWLREGSRYQVRMATSIGPVLSRSISSEGELTPLGLAPRRFDAEQKVLFRAARRWSLRFGPERIVTVDGREIDTLPGAQDEASQFVQLTWLFTSRPERLAVGQAIEVPLIVSRTLERWTYDVVAEELLQFPFGAVPSFHVKPRREAKGGDLSAEIWFAPTLQYLPVRILIRQGVDSWIDLTLERPPLQAAAAAGVPAPGPATPASR